MERRRKIMVGAAATVVVLGLGTAAPAPAQVAADRVITVGTLSKSFWGGLRVGWLRAEPDVIQRLTAAAVRAQMSGPVLEQLAACHLLDADGSDGTALQGRRDLLRTQRDALVGALGAALPGWRVPMPAGGLVLWCQLPAPCSNALVDAAQQRGLRLAAGPRFGTGHAFADRLRLPYTQPVDVLQRAVEILADVSDTLPQTDPGPGPSRIVV